MSWEEVAAANQNPQPQDSAAELELDSTLDTALTEDQLLALLERLDVSAAAIEKISQHSVRMKSRKVSVAMAGHPRAPRHLALRLMRRFYTFDLMQLALKPQVAADLKRQADNLLIARVDSITPGERLTLARRASGAVAAALLLDKESGVVRAALGNARLTEAAIVKVLAGASATPALLTALCQHPKWSVRREVQIALLRNRHTPLGFALEFGRRLPAPLLRDVLHSSRLPDQIKHHLRNEMKGQAKS
jgi:hypothetical protein